MPVLREQPICSGTRLALMDLYKEDKHSKDSVETHLLHHLVRMARLARLDASKSDSSAPQMKTTRHVLEEAEYYLGVARRARL